MTFAAEVLKIGRQPINQVELTLDACDNIYGLSPCTATDGVENLMLKSEFINQSQWVKTRLTVTGNVADGPLPIGGTNVGDRIIPSVVSGTHQIHQEYTPLAAERIFTSSFHVSLDNLASPAIRYHIVNLRYEDIGNGVIAEVLLDLDTGAVALITGGTGTVLDFGVVEVRPNDPDSDTYYRIFLAVQRDSSGTEAQRTTLRIHDPTRDITQGTGNSWVGNATDGLIVWGGQVRRGQNPGKYIMTDTVVVKAGDDRTAHDLCYNTFATCQDTPNYVKTDKVYTFIDPIAQPYGIEGFPVIKNISYAATKIDPGQGLGARAKVTITLQDFPHNDYNLIDEYSQIRGIPIVSGVTTAQQNQENFGTFFGKLKARNQYYVGRKIVLKEGYLDDTGAITFTKDREYIVDDISGPDGSGIVRITAKDILKLAANEKAEAPTPALKTWKLNGALGTTGNPLADSTALAQAIWDEADGTGSTGSSNRHIRIGDEIMSLGVRPTSTAIPVLRAAGGTTTAAHDDDSTIQPCLSYGAESISLIMQELLEDFSAVPAAFITIADWNTEKTNDLTNFDLTTIIPEPTGVSKLLKELSRLALVDLWWSDLDQQIRFKVQSPYQVATIPLLTDDLNILSDSLKVKDVAARRLSRVIIWYGIRNYAEDLTEPRNYRRASFEIEADKEGANKYNQIQTQRIFNRWQLAADTTEVELTSNRLVTRYGNMPIEVTFKIDAQDVETIDTGDVFDLSTRQIQDADGMPFTTRLQVMELRPLKGGSTYMVKAFAFFTDPVTESALTITTNRTDLDLFVELNGPSSPITKEIIIDTGVIIDATEGNPAINMGALPAGSDITLTIKGTIRGHAGRGGVGGKGKYRAIYDPAPPATCFVTGTGFDGMPGQVGGDAIAANVANPGTLRVTVESTGEVFGGGGGGGAGKGFAVSTETGDVSPGAGGGGGQGSDGVGSGGNDGVTDITLQNCGAPTDRDPGNDGVDGSVSALGAGGATHFSATAGGNGGGWGIDGVDSPSESTPGGDAGYAVRYNGSAADEDFQSGSDVRGLSQ